MIFSEFKHRGVIAQCVNAQVQRADGINTVNTNRSSVAEQPAHFRDYNDQFSNSNEESSFVKCHREHLTMPTNNFHCFPLRSCKFKALKVFSKTKFTSSVIASVHETWNWWNA